MTTLIERGVIEAVGTPKDVKGGHKSYSFKVNGEWYSTLSSEKAAGMVRGKEVEFTWKQNGNFRNLEDWIGAPTLESEFEQPYGASQPTNPPTNNSNSDDLQSRIQWGQAFNLAHATVLKQCDGVDIEVGGKEFWNLVRKQATICDWFISRGRAKVSDQELELPNVEGEQSTMIDESAPQSAYREGH